MSSVGSFSTTASGRFESFASGCNGSTLLKKSALVTTAEKLAFEIEILKIGIGLRAQISRSDAQRRRFYRSLVGLFG